MTRKRLNLKNIALDVLMDVVGGFFYAAGVYTFAAANSFTSGGISGCAIILNHVVPALPIGIVTLVLNIPLVILGIVKLGKKMVLKTVKSVIIISLITDIIMPLIPVYTGDRMLAALACGFSMGLGIATIFVRGSSTGGTDFLTLSLKKRFPHLNVGTIVFAEDALVIGISMLVFKDFDAALYSALAIFVCGKVIDGVTYGFESGAVLFIVTDRPDEISREIAECIDRSSTLIPAKGAYSGAPKTVLMVVLRKNQIIHVKRAVRRFDGTAFMTALEATEVLGEGFKPHTD